MPNQVDQQAVWTPPVIATIVYQAVMIIVSLAFIWKKYRRPTRKIDEEQFIGILLHARSITTHRTRSENEHTKRRRPAHVVALRDFIMDNLKDNVQSALGLDGDCDDTDGLKLPFDNPSGDPSTSETVGSSLNSNFGLDIELGDIGLRHRSADGMSDTKKKGPR